MPGQRWIRLDVDWEEVEWLDDLDGTAAGCWPRLMCLVKSQGSKGRCRRVSPKILARKWRVPVEAVEALEAAALAVDGDGLILDGSDWVVVRWDDTQKIDRTATERQRRRRERDVQADPPSQPQGRRDFHRRGGPDARAMAAFQLWNEKNLPLPRSVSEKEHLDALTMLFCGDPPMKTSEITEVITRISADTSRYEWAAKHGPVYLNYKPAGRARIAEQILTDKPKSEAQHSRPQQASAEERSRNLRERMRAQ